MDSPTSAKKPSPLPLPFSGAIADQEEEDGEGEGEAERATVPPQGSPDRGRSRRGEGWPAVVAGQWPEPRKERP